MCALLIWYPGCPKRQESKGIVVYVPAPVPAPAAQPPEAEPKVLVIQEPAPPPPEPEEAEEPPTPEQSTAPADSEIKHVRKHPSEETTAEPVVPVAPPAEVPALEPRQSSAQENELRHQFQNLDQDFRDRLARLNPDKLSPNDQKTLQDARTFFAQATEAMESGDLPRALNLARKAGLLLAAVE